MKRTKTYQAASQKYYEIEKAVAVKFDNDELYAYLERKGFWWNADTGEWCKGNKPSTSIFKTDDDVASGVIRLRVMAHPDDVENAVKLAKKTPGMRVIDISDPYPNRKGAGVRIYLTAVLDTQ